MIITKNSYGITSVYKYRCQDKFPPFGEFKGSSLDRSQEKTEDAFIKRLINKPMIKQEESEKQEQEPKVMSRRTKAKIRNKIMVFSRLSKYLNFLTLTFVNKVTDQKAIKILHSFLDNANKRSKEFMYLWVAEKQTENKVFKNNIHFHIITNKRWEINKWWNYWIELQAKNGIVARDENFKPSSAFDVKSINKNNVKGLGNYLTHYITKNEGEFFCQIWNCSKMISILNTSMIEDMSFIHRIESLEKQNLLGGVRKIFSYEYCTIHTIPLNRITVNLYNKIDQKNKQLWDNEKEAKNEL